MHKQSQEITLLIDKVNAKEDFTYNGHKYSPISQEWFMATAIDKSIHHGSPVHKEVLIKQIEQNYSM